MKGWPDYTRTTGLVENYDEYAQNYPVGIGDGAARIGSIKTYDMRGRVWWMDNFEAATLHWVTQSHGIGGSQQLTPAYARNGEQSVELISNIGIGRTSHIERFISLPPRVKIGTEIHFSMEDGFGSAVLTALLYDGVNLCRASMRINEAANQVQYRDAAGNYIDTGLDPALTGIESHFHSLKMVWDYSTDEYLRIMYDHQETNMHHAAMDTEAWPVAPMMEIMAGNMGNNADNIPIHVDDFILTYMEPE